LKGVLGEVAKTDPRKAADMLGKMDPADRAGAYRAVAAQYGALDFSEAKFWIQTLPADDQAKALAAAIGGLSNTDPVAASQQVAAMEAGYAKDRLIPTVVKDLARKDPQVAVDFLKQQDSEKAQVDGMDEVMPALVTKNPLAALAFVNSYAAGPVRDAAALAYVESNHVGAPADLIKVAETITDDGDRNRAMRMSAMSWMREDAAAATAYIQASTALSDEMKKRLIEGHGKSGGGKP